MKRLFTLTLLSLFAISCSYTYRSKPSFSKSSTMTFGVGEQPELDAANRRITEFKQELLRQGFREVSVAFSDSKEQFVLEGKYGTLQDLQVTLWTETRLKEDQPELGGGVKASLRDEQAEREFEELYKRICFVVTGQDQ